MAINNDADGLDERDKLWEHLALTHDEGDANAKLKSAQESLMAQVASRYGTLTLTDIQSLPMSETLSRISTALQWPVLPSRKIVDGLLR